MLLLKSITCYRFLPTKAHRKAQAMEGEVRRLFRKMIDERIRKRRAGIEDGRDMFDLFLDELYDEKQAKQVDVNSIVEDAIANCKVFFFAGYETTSTLLIWIMVNLAIHKEWQDRGREEVLRVLGGRKKLTPDDMSQLKMVLPPLPSPHLYGIIFLNEMVIQYLCVGAHDRA